MKIRAGQVVMLNSGGPAMTVVDVTGNTAHCTWNAQAGGAALQQAMCSPEPQIRTHDFNVACLTVLPKAKKA